MAINPDATLIPDKAEVWLALAADVVDIDDMIPADPSDDLGELGWEHVGLIDEANGIPLTPSVEVVKYDAFGYPGYRMKLRKGDLKTGFTILEDNDVTRQVVFPGSTSTRLGIPKDNQIYVLYRFEDGDNVRVWVSLRPGPVEVTSTTGIVDGEEFQAECIVHHTPTADGDVFEVVNEAPVVVSGFSAPSGGGTGGASGSSGASGASGS